MEQFFADKTRVLWRPHWLSKSPNTHQKIAPVAVVFSGVNGLFTTAKAERVAMMGMQLLRMPTERKSRASSPLSVLG